MIEFREALKKANEYHAYLSAIRVAELIDSRVFTMGSIDGETVYGPKPIRVMKSDGKTYEWDTIKYSNEFKEKFFNKVDL